MSNQIPAEPKNTLAREMVCFILQVMENKMRLGRGRDLILAEISFSIQPVSPHFTMFCQEALKGFGWISSMVIIIK